MSALQAGLKIKNFEEFPFECFKRLEIMNKREDGYWELPKEFPSLPGLFLLLTEKEANA